jgi:hypothetical protein
MSNTKTGGPAFPQQDDASGSEGMTLRDYFAAKAMQAALSRHGFYDDEPQFAAWCYETADAMLKVREV